MKNIGGGWAENALEVLLGRPGEHSKINSGPAQKDRTRKLASLPWSKPEIQTYDKVAVPQDNYDGLVSQTIFNDTDKVDSWMAWVKQKPNQKAIERVFKQQRGEKILGVEVDYKSEVRLEHFVSVFHKNNLDTDLKLPLLTYLAHHFPGKRGRGVYTDHQQEIFQQIVDALGEGKNVVVSTKEEVGRNVTGVGHSGGEKQSKGLAGNHAYPVLGTKQKDNLRYVKLRNPWGEYGREYEREGNKLKAKENETFGSFYVELTDLTKRFYRLATGGG